MKPIVKQMMKAYGKNVKAICVDGEEYTGHIIIFTHDYDNENGEHDIILELKDGSLFGLFESDIASLEIIE